MIKSRYYVKRLIAVQLVKIVMPTGRQEAAIWHRVNIFCEEPLKKIVMLTNQIQLIIRRPIFEMPLARYYPIHSKECTKIAQLEWATMRPEALTISMKLYSISNHINCISQQKKFQNSNRLLDF